MAETARSGAEIRYKIGDVCRIADVQPYVLRYWESEFPVLAPDKSIPGPRTYSALELDLIGRIKRLLYDEGYTIAGAKKRLEAEASGEKAPDTNPVVTPLDEARSEKPVGSGRPFEKVPVRARSSSKAGLPLFVETAPEEDQPPPAGAASDVGPAKAKAMETPDPRVARVVAELKEILEILSRD